PNLDAKPVYRLDDRLRASDGPGRSVEGREEPVTGGIDLGAPIPAQQAAHDGVMLLDESLPSGMAQLHRFPGGSDDVGEENRRQDPRQLGLLVADRADEPLDLAHQGLDVSNPRAMVHSG